MKFFMLLLMFVSTAQAAIVRDAQVDFNKKLVSVDLTYFGGCIEHTFKVSPPLCTKSIPASCTVQVLDVTEGLDTCEAVVPTRAQFSFQEMGISPGETGVSSLTFLGDDGSAAKVSLIEVKVAVETFTSFTGPFVDENGRNQRMIMKVSQTGEILLTKNGVEVFSGQPSLYQDARPFDGPLVLGLGPATLTVGSGFTRTGLASYSLNLEGQNVLMTPNVFLNIVK